MYKSVDDSRPPLCSGNSSAKLVPLSSSSSQTSTIVNKVKSCKQDPFHLSDLSKQIHDAKRHTNSTAFNKLSVIADQVKFLQEQAHLILNEATRNRLLHENVACNFKKVPGQIYHLYQNSNNSSDELDSDKNSYSNAYFSMISPQEWGIDDGDIDKRNTDRPSKSDSNRVHLGSFRLENDMSWTPVENIKNVDGKKAVIDKFISSHSYDSPSHLKLDFYTDS